MRAAAIQLNSTPDADRNLEVADRLVRACGAELVVLPEKWPLLGTPEETVAHDPAEAARWAAGIAAELGIDLIAGSWSEDGFNTSVHYGPSGEVARYRKIHLFDVTVGDTVYSESALERGGSDVVLSSTSDGVELGLSICYDLRFPELYRSLAVGGARVFPVPSAFTVPTTRDHWEVLLRARAIEDQCFVVAANQVGAAGPAGPVSGGRSMIVDPWGVVLACAADRETYVVAELDLDAQADVRRKIPSLANRVLV